MKRSLLLSVLPLLGAGLLMTGCGDDEPTEPDVTPTTFTVTIENVSQPQTVPTDRADGIVPLSPGVYAVYDGSDPIFTLGGTADAGLELIAEDGETATEAADLAANTEVASSGEYKSANGPIVPNDPATFTITAEPGDHLQIALMFVQSNDWFYSFAGGGLELFDGDTPVSGDVTANLALYDAGTEEDTAPGVGPDQKPAQGDEINVGPADDNTTIRLASEDGFTIPATNSVIKVTITPAQ